MTTNAGRFFVLAAQAVDEPRAHARPAGELRSGLEERDGRIVIDRFGVHRLDEQRSSAIFAVCGSNSLTHAPDLPCCANLNIDGTTGKVRSASPSCR